jgi:sialidase-1
LALCEGRKNGQDDSGDIDIVYKRSTDGGRTWSRLQVLWDDGVNTCGNPCIVADKRSGTLWLLMTHNLGTDREADIVAGPSRGTRTVWVTSSQDDGRTWSRPREITAAVKNRHGVGMPLVPVWASSCKMVACSSPAITRPMAAKL